MKVKEIKTVAPTTCTPEATLAEAANRMWESDRGVLPVVDTNRTLIRMLSLNDIALAAGDNGPVRDRDVVDALQSIYAPPGGTPDQAAA